MKDTVKAILAIILVLVICVGLAFAFGWIEVGYKNTVGVASSSADHKVFTKGTAYVEGKIADLAKYKLELSRETDKTARLALVQFITEEFANFDVNQIEDLGLQSFLLDVRNGNIQ